jgi:WD40 repeat protein/predicted Ser/Thr protein kinase
MSEVATCPACGEPLPASSPGGHCPRCLLERTLVEPEVPLDESPWMRLGDYDLLEEIGRGGMGVVYRARQRGLKRTVAVKMLLGAGLSAPGQRQRFFREAEAAARLRHPRIVAVHEMGESEDGVPWFSMDYIAGRPLDAVAGQATLTDREAATCLREIALAVAHAHERGVLHRDLKPSNILIDSDGAPHVTDFGIAARLGRSTPEPHLTRTGQSLGSPGYAAPEMALGAPPDARTDVYGLGAILYHCLTARPPHSGPTLESVLLQVRETPPVPPQRLNPMVSRDLQTICLKCLAKLPADRFPSADALADDLGRFLDGHSIRARPIGLVGRLWRWSRRRPAIASLLALLGLVTVAGLASVWHFVDRQHDLEHRDRLATESRAILERPVTGSRDRALAAIKAAWEIQPSADLRKQAIAALSQPDWRVLPEMPPSAAGEPADLSRSGDGTHSVRVEKGVAQVTEIATGRTVAEIPGFTSSAQLQLDERATRLAVARNGSSDLEVFSLPDGATLFTCEHPQPVVSLDWSRDTIAASCQNRTISIWSAKDGRLCHRLIGHDSPGVTVRFRPGGVELASIAQDNLVRLWHAPRGELLMTADLGSNNNAPAWWTEDGGEFRFGTLDRRGIRRLAPVWPASVRLIAPIHDEPGPENMLTMDISPDGTLISTSDDGVCRLWDSTTGLVLATIPKGAGEWNVTRFSPDGKTLWVSGWDRGLTPWPIVRASGGKVELGPPGEPLFGSGNLLREQSRDGQRFVLGNNDDGVFLVGDLKQGIVATLPHPGVLSAALSPDGQWVATSSYTVPEAKIWSLPDGKWVRDLPSPGIVGSLSFSPDGESLTLRSANGSVCYRTATWEKDPAHSGRENINGSILSLDGRLLACFEGQDIRLLDPETWEEILRLPTPPAAGWLGGAQIAFSANAETLAVRAATGAVIVWDLPGLRRELEEIGMAW